MNALDALRIAKQLNSGKTAFVSTEHEKKKIARWYETYGEKLEITPCNDGWYLKRKNL